jgi:hypothetical protein
MCRSSSRSPEDREWFVQSAVLSEIVTLHPDHLTPEELVLRMEDGLSDTRRVEVIDALQALKGAGLARFNGEVVEPTHAALRAAALHV